MQLTKEKAKELYDYVPDSFRAELEKEFGKKTFVKAKFENLKTFDDCCRAIGTSEEEFNRKFSNSGLDADTIAYEKLKIVNAAINEGWIPDYRNTNQRKWFPVFASDGFAYLYSDSAASTTIASVGARLCFESEERSTYSATQFSDIWKTFIYGI